MPYIIILILLTLITIILIKLYLLNKAIISINDTLEIINKDQTNLLVTSNIGNKNVNKLVININNNLISLNNRHLALTQEEKTLKNTIANISHDLRTPVTSLLGYFELYKNEEEATKKEEYLLIINNRLKVIKELTESLFNYTLLFDYDEILNLKRENISLILEESIALYYKDITFHNIIPTIEIEDNVFKKVDKIALKRVFSNLISNAIKYGEKSLKIILTKDKIIFSNKASISNSIDVSAFFDRYKSLSSTGLGLTIVKTLIDKMNGEIKSELKNDVLSFTIKL